MSRSQSPSNSEHSKLESEHIEADKACFLVVVADCTKVWQRPVFERVCEAVEIVPQALRKTALDYQAIACLLPLSSQGGFENAIDDLQPLADGIEAVILECNSWDCPVANLQSEFHAQEYNRQTLQVAV